MTDDIWVEKIGRGWNERLDWRRTVIPMRLGVPVNPVKDIMMGPETDVCVFF
jgi:hypothetical protein